MRVFALFLLLASFPLIADETRLVRSERICTSCSSIAADVNGDGLDDLIDNRSIRFNLGGTFSDPVALTGIKAGELPVAWGDFNGDGIADVFVHAFIDLDTFGPDRLLAGNGFGRFSAAPYAFGDAGGIVKAADIDRDGDLDLVLENRDGDFFLLRNDGAASFERLPWIAALPYDVAFGDFDSDGLFDIVEARADSLFFTYGNGTSRTLFTGLEPRAIQTADMNGDGRLDIVLDDVSPHSFGVTVLFGDGLGESPGVTRVQLDPTEATSVVGDYFIGGGDELALARGAAVVVYSASGGKLHEIARYEPDHATAYAIARGNFANGPRAELLASINTPLRSEQYMLVPQGFVSSRRRAVGGVAARDAISGSWLASVESDCALPDIGALTLVRRGISVDVASSAIPSASIAWIPGDEVLIVQMQVGLRPLHGELQLDEDGTIHGTLTEDYTPCTMRRGGHRVTLTRLSD